MNHSIATLGSHSALQILKGAKDEGFRTIAVCEKGREKPYKSFRVADEIIIVNKFSELPKICKTPKEIDRTVIVKFYGAHGGKGFFLAKNAEEFYTKMKGKEGKLYMIQEYVIGAPMYAHYFYSPINDELELMSFDKRYESNVDSIGRIAAKDQLDMGLETSYNITG